MAHEDERSLQKGPEQNHPTPLMEALGMAIVEFEQFPWERDQNDAPYLVAYLRGERALVMLQRNRPSREGFLPLPSHHDGYFAEAFDIDENGRAQNGVSDPSVLNGSFRRIDVTDESDNPYHGSIYITPTRFPYISRKFFGKMFENQPPALPGTADEKTGTLGQLFAQEQMRNASRSQSEQAKRGLREEIIKRYFRETVQGFSEKVGNEHFVITKDKQSPLVLASKALGVPTHIIRPGKNWDGGSSTNPLEALKDSRGLLPMIISAEGRYSQKDKDPRHSVRIEAGYYASKLPLFAFIDLDKDRKGQTTIGKVHSGWYHVRGEDPKVLKRLIMKVGIDFLLTSKVRELAGGFA